MKVLGVGRFREFKLMKPSNNHKVVHKSETYFMIIKKTTTNEKDEKDAEISLRFIRLLLHVRGTASRTSGLLSLSRFVTRSELSIAIAGSVILLTGRRRSRTGSGGRSGSGSGSGVIPISPISRSFATGFPV